MINNSTENLNSRQCSARRCVGTCAGGLAVLNARHNCSPARLSRHEDTAECYNGKILRVYIIYEYQEKDISGIL